MVAFYFRLIDAHQDCISEFKVTKVLSRKLRRSKELTAISTLVHHETVLRSDNKHDGGV